MGARIVGRRILEGELVLKSPLMIGMGTEDLSHVVDMVVLKDRDGVPFVPATSLIGVLRSAMGKDFKDFFGTATKEGKQSCLKADDITLSGADLIYRDGNVLDEVRSVSLNRYDYELVARGAKGSIRLELIEREGVALPYAEFTERLAAVLTAGISLGAKATSGLGRVMVENLTIDRYDYSKKADVRRYLLGEKKQVVFSSAEQYCNPKDLVIEGTFALKSGLMVGDSDGYAMKAEGEHYLIPGSSIKGVLRHQLGFLLHALNLDKAIETRLFGSSEAKGRLYVDDVRIRKTACTSKEVTRVRLDRFTGGAIGHALITNKPIFQKGDEVFKLKLVLKEARDEEIGLMLLLLRDLWQGYLALGGDKAIGRGIVAGKSAVLKFSGKEWHFAAKGLVEGESLAKYVEAAVS